MIRFYFHPTPNHAKVTLLLEELGLAYEVVPIDTSKGERHSPAFRAINPNGKVPRSSTPMDLAASTPGCSSSAILLYLGDKTGRFIDAAADRPELLSWLFFIGTGLGPFSAPSVEKTITDLPSVTTVGLDLAKHVFQVHGVDASGRVGE